jgi:hypothetical protein
LREEFKHFSGLRDQWVAKQLAAEEAERSKEASSSTFDESPELLPRSGSVEDMASSHRSVKKLFSSTSLRKSGNPTELDKRALPKELSSSSLRPARDSKADVVVGGNRPGKESKADVEVLSLPKNPRGPSKELSGSGGRVINTGRSPSTSASSSVIEEDNIADESPTATGGNKFSRFMKKKLGK